jgi:hypothetical protein
MIDNELLDRRKAVPVVEKMDSIRLEEYIEKRLKRIFIRPPLASNTDEPPEYFLEKIYETSESEEFKTKFRCAIAELLKKEQNKISDPDYVSTLLSFCEQYVISEAIVSVSGLAASGQVKGIESIDGDLHYRVLMALARMPQGLEMTVIWVNAIDDSRYTAAAFAALREQGLEKICRYLPYFIRMCLENPSSIDMNIALMTLYDKFLDEGYSEDEITDCIAQSIKKESKRIKDEIKNTLEALNKVPPSPLEDEEEDTNRGIGEILRKVADVLFALLLNPDIKKAKEFAPAAVKVLRSIRRKLRIIKD